MSESGGKRSGDTDYGKRFDDHTLKQLLRSWPVIVAIISACWILFEKIDGKFSAIDNRLASLEMHNAVTDDKIDNIQENVKLLLKR
jgi:hypothetical protein